MPIEAIWQQSTYMLSIAETQCIAKFLQCVGAAGATGTATVGFLGLTPGSCEEIWHELGFAGMRSQE